MEGFAKNRKMQSKGNKIESVVVQGIIDLNALVDSIST